MSPEISPPDPPRPPPWYRACSAISGSVVSLVRTVRDPTLPFLVLGSIVAAFVATLVFHAPGEIVFGLLFIGILTAFLETKMHNDNRDR
jgi:hypothetical protein